MKSPRFHLRWAIAVAWLVLCAVIIYFADRGLLQGKGIAARISLLLIGIAPVYPLVWERAKAAKLCFGGG